jgi:hypothetical protein
VLYSNITKANSYYKYQKIIYNASPGIRTALYLGLGGGAMVKDLYKNTEASIDVVEIDPGVTKATEEFFNLTPNKRLNIYNGDGRFFQLVSIEAANNMKQHLTKNGSVFINVISSVSGRRSAPLKSLCNTFSSVFPYTYLFPLDPNNQTKLQNIVVIAGNREYSKQYLMNQLSYIIGAAEANTILKDYSGCLSTVGYPILTDDKNPYDVYAASAISGLVP